MLTTRAHSRRSTLSTALLILLTVASAAACGRSQTAASTAQSPDGTAAVTDPAGATPDALLGNWLAEDFITVGALRPVPDDLVAGIRFEDGSTVRIETGCSHETANVAFASDPEYGTTLVLSGLTVTATLTCDERAADTERDLLELLGHPLSWGVRDGQLKLLPTDITDSGLILRIAAAKAAKASGASDPDTIAALLAVAANHRIRTANGSDTQNGFSAVAILDTYGVATDDGLLDAWAGPVPIPNDVRRAIEAMLGPITVRWVASASDVPTEPTATWDEQPLPALLTLADPTIDGETAIVISDLKCGPRCVIGGGQEFELGTDLLWVAVRSVGPQWHS